ncbi:MAG: dienelactone hydrolase family protein, partial [Knoellia sp.]
MEIVEIAMPDGGLAEAYVARPRAESLTAQGDVVRTDLPGVLFYMDAIGLRPRIEQMAQRIADWGYVVLAPNVFFREGLAADLAPQRDLTEPGARQQFFALASPRVRRLGAPQAERDIPAYLKVLRDLKGVGHGAIGTTGYCMGARLAVR